MMDAAGFITELVVHFPIKHEDEAKQIAWLTAMGRELRGYPSNILEEAAREIIRSRRRRDFPLASECRQACDSAQNRLRASVAAETLPLLAHPREKLEWAPERLKLAEELICTEMGKQAAKEGWIGTLHTYARKNGRLPTTAKEIALVKKQAAEFDAAYKSCVQGGWSNAYVLEKLGAQMLKERDKLRRKVLGL